MIHFTFLNSDQILGGPTSKQLKIFEKRGTKAVVSDYAITLGGYVSTKFHMENQQSLSNRTGWYWTKTLGKDNQACAINPNGELRSCETYGRYIGIRLAVAYSEIKDIAKNIMKADDGIIEMDCGVLPNRAEDANTQKLLEKLYQKQELKQFRSYYTIDSRKDKEYNKAFKERYQIIMEYNNQKFIRIKSEPFYKEFKLSNEVNYKEENYIWIPLTSIRWWADEEADMAITKDIIFAGIQFNGRKNYNGIFEETDIYNYIYKYLIKDMFKFRTEEIIANNRQSYNQTKNPIMITANLENKFGIDNLNFCLPQETIQNLDKIIVQANNDNGKKIVYQKVKK